MKVASVPHYEGLSVQDMLDYARKNSQHLKYFPEEQDWLHLDWQWICDVLYTLDTVGIQKMIDDAMRERKDKLE